jgi:hypothetical protein
MSILTEVFQSDSRSDVRRVLELLLESGRVVDELMDYYLTGREPRTWTFLEDLPESRLVAAIRAMCPDAERGLGTFDRLLSIGLIDELYLLLRQVEFYKGSDLLQLSPSGAADGVPVPANGTQPRPLIAAPAGTVPA